jgi:hypothetical protein
MLDVVVKTLKHRASQYHCDRSEIDWVSYDEIENEVFSEFANDSEHFVRVSARVFELLRADDHVTVQEFDGTTVFVARSFDRPWQCSVRLFLYRHMYFIVFGTVILTGIGLFLFWRRNQREIAGECRGYADLVIQHLRFEMKGGHRTSHQLRSWLNQQTSGHAEKYWPRIEALLAAAPFVEVRPIGGGQTFRYQTGG